MVAKDNERLLRKNKKSKIIENIASDESIGKDGEMLLVKSKKKKIKKKRTFVESIGVCKSPSEFEKGLKIQKGKDGEKVLVKAKKRKIKENRTSDESIGACESLEFEEGPKTQVIKDSERLLGKTKHRKIKEHRASNECISVYRSSEFEKRPTTQKEKDGERLMVKAQKRKLKMNRISDESIGACESPSELEKGLNIQKGKDGERLLVKPKKRKRKENRISDDSVGACEFPIEFEKGPKIQEGRRSTKVDSRESPIQSETLNKIDSSIEPVVTANEPKAKTSKFKKNRKDKKKHPTNVKESDIEEVQSVVDGENVDEIPSVDDDCTRGMKKWLTQYKESRPGLKVLQQRIDEFVTAHEERLEQERKEREARAAEDGWTVVVHQKGRKKTTDAETGTAVGSVAPAAVMDKISKKKSKEIALDFYRFQKREAKRNELMMLQSKFEQDKKRIQQLRAARKFRPS